MGRIRRSVRGLVIFFDSGEQVDDPIGDDLGSEGLVTQPDEGYVETFLSRKDVLVEAIGFAYLPLDAIAVDSMLEVTLGNGNEDLGDRFRPLHIDYTKGKG